MNHEQRQYNKMINTPVKRLVMSLAAPTIVSMLITSIYNLADTFFVSQLGVSASGAVGVVFPVMAIIQAVGFTLGMGGGSNISAKLGEKKDIEAQRIGSSAFYSALLIGTIIAIFGLLFVDNIMVLLGATETVLPHARAYGNYIFIGAPIMAASFVLNNILRSEGKAKFAMVGLTTGGILNIVLDPIFIHNFGLGIAGAAIATIISQIVSFLILLSFFLTKKSIITLSPKYIAFDAKPYLEIVGVGLPSLIRQGFSSISSIILNTQAGAIGGDPALSAMSIVTKIMMVIFGVALGIGQGFQPVCGYNYSSNHFKRVKESIIFTFIMCTLVMSVLGGVFYLTSDFFVELFIKDEAENVAQVVEIGGQALRYVCMIMPLMGINLLANMTYQAMRRKWRATLLSSCRHGIFFIPLGFILPAWLGLTGVELIQPMADLLTSLFSIPFLVGIIKHMNIKEEIQNELEKNNA